MLILRWLGRVTSSTGEEEDGGRRMQCSYCEVRLDKIAH